MVRLVVPRFHVRVRQFVFGICQQQRVDLARADLLRAGIAADVNARSLVKSSTKERDCFHVDATRILADAALLDLRALDPLKRE